MVARTRGTPVLTKTTEVVIQGGVDSSSGNPESGEVLQGQQNQNGAEEDNGQHDNNPVAPNDTMGGNGFIFGAGVSSVYMFFIMSIKIYVNFDTPNNWLWI